MMFEISGDQVDRREPGRWVAELSPAGALAEARDYGSSGPSAGAP